MTGPLALERGGSSGAGRSGTEQEGWSWAAIRSRQRLASLLESRNSRHPEREFPWARRRRQCVSPTCKQRLQHPSIIPAIFLFPLPVPLPFSYTCVSHPPVCQAPCHQTQWCSLSASLVSPFLCKITSSGRYKCHLFVGVRCITISTCFLATSSLSRFVFFFHFLWQPHPWFVHSLFFLVLNRISFQ